MMGFFKAFTACATHDTGPTHTQATPTHLLAGAVGNANALAEPTKKQRASGVRTQPAQPGHHRVGCLSQRGHTARMIRRFSLAPCITWHLAGLVPPGTSHCIPPPLHLASPLRHAHSSRPQVISTGSVPTVSVGLQQARQASSATGGKPMTYIQAHLLRRLAGLPGHVEVLQSPPEQGSWTMGTPAVRMRRVAKLHSSPKR